MAIGRKGFFFTVAAIVLVSVIMLYITAQQENRLRQKSAVIEQRVKSLDRFMQDIKRDVERGGYIASFRALLAIQQYIISKGGYLPDEPQEMLAELIVNGTIEGEYISVMNSTELSVWTERIEFEAEKTGIDVNCTVESVTIEQTDPWTLLVVMRTMISLKDRSGLAYWNTQKDISSTLSIIGFEDPIYSVETLGRVINTIERTPYESLVSGTDATNLKDHALNSYYLESNISPSYLMRLAGNFSPSQNGIESLVNLLELDLNDLPVQNKSCADHIYFSAQDPPSYLLNGTFNWLRLDNSSGRLSHYQADAIAIP